MINCRFVLLLFIYVNGHSSVIFIYFENDKDVSRCRLETKLIHMMIHLREK